MATIDLNAEIYEALSIIAKDESLLKKAVRSLKRLATQKMDETMMTEEEFFVTVDKSLEEASMGKTKCLNSPGELSTYLDSL